MWPSWAEEQILQAEGHGVTSASSFGCCFPINPPVLGKWKVSQSEGNSFETHGGGMGETCDPRVAEAGKEPLALSG